MITDPEELYYKLLEDATGYLGRDEITDEADEALAAACKLLVLDPSDAYGDSGLYHDDPNGRYQMYTPEGNAAVAKMVEDLQHRMLHEEIIRVELGQVLVDAMKEVAKTHPEIYDTEPRGEISDRISETCDMLMWKGVEL